jgi:hypothetical protein
VDEGATASTDPVSVGGRLEAMRRDGGLLPPPTLCRRGDDWRLCGMDGGLLPPPTLCRWDDWRLCSVDGGLLPPPTLCRRGDDWRLCVDGLAGSRDSTDAGRWNLSSLIDSSSLSVQSPPIYGDFFSSLPELHLGRPASVKTTRQRR